MDSGVFFWLLLTLLCLLVEAFYTSMEMAIVSLNKVRLQYLVSKSNRRAMWVDWLLQHPSRLFGTTLLGSNLAMQVGSECSRRFYMALDSHPEIAPITQIFLVLIFAELAPIFAARRYPEHLSLAGSAIVYLSAKCMAPAIWTISALARFTNWMVGGKEVKNEGFISRDELEVMLETRDQEPVSASEAEELNLLARNIFSFRNKTAVDAMVSLSNVRGIPSNSTVGHMQHVLMGTEESFLPIFHREPTNIVGIAFARDLVKVPNSHRARDYARPPWFITKGTELMQILQQFRNNNQTVAIVLDDQGRGIGVLTLEDVIEEIFPQIATQSKRSLPGRIAVDKVFPGDTKVSEFNRQFSEHIDADPNHTLAQLLEEAVGHHPEKDESIVLGRFQLSVEEASLLEIKRVRVRTR